MQNFFLQKFLQTRPFEKEKKYICMQEESLNIDSFASYYLLSS